MSWENVSVTDSGSSDILHYEKKWIFCHFRPHTTVAIRLWISEYCVCMPNQEHSGSFLRFGNLSAMHMHITTHCTLAALGFFFPEAYELSKHPCAHCFHHLCCLVLCPVCSRNDFPLLSLWVGKFPLCGPKWWGSCQDLWFRRGHAIIDHCHLRACWSLSILLLSLKLRLSSFLQCSFRDRGG